MKQLLLILGLMILNVFVYSQDVIERTNGKKIICKITSEDSTKIYFDLRKDGKDISTYLDKKDVLNINRSIILPSRTYMPDIVSMGFGLGLNYGGLGGSLLVYPQKNIGIFASGGFAFIGFGYNAGIKVRAIKKTNTTIVTPTATFMYGYHSFIMVKNGSDFNKFFYGYSLGFGIDAHFKRRNNGYWSFDLFIPFRGPEVNNYIDDLKEDHGVEFESELSPVTFSIGYRITID